MRKHTATKIITPNWEEVRTASDLRRELGLSVGRLKSLDYHDKAEAWSKRLANIPSRMSKEAINYVLFAATKEIEGMEE